MSRPVASGDGSGVIGRETANVESEVVLDPQDEGDAS